MIALLVAAQLAAAPLASPPEPLLTPRAGVTNGGAKLCAASGKLQAATPEVFTLSERRHAYKLIDLPPGRLCLAGGTEK